MQYALPSLDSGLAQRQQLVWDACKRPLSTGDAHPSRILCSRSRPPLERMCLVGSESTQLVMYRQCLR